MLSTRNYFSAYRFGLYLSSKEGIFFESAEAPVGIELSLSAVGLQLIIFENSPRLLAREPPIDLCPLAIDAAIPNPRFLLQLT